MHSHCGDVDTTTLADKVDHWREQIENELSALDFFESMGRYFVIEPCKSNHARMVAESAEYRTILRAMLHAIETKGRPTP